MQPQRSRGASPVQSEVFLPNSSMLKNTLGVRNGTRSPSPSPSTASLRSRSPSPMLKTQTNGAGWGHWRVEMPSSYLAMPSSPNHPRSPSPGTVPLDETLSVHLSVRIMPTQRQPPPRVAPIVPATPHGRL